MKKTILLLALTFWGFSIGAQESLSRYYAPVKSFQPKGIDYSKIKETTLDNNSEENNNWNIPVVFHVISDDKEPTITREQILSQLESLNRDFSNRTERPSGLKGAMRSYADLAVDTEIQFCLASNLSKGETINYYSIPNQKWEDPESVKLVTKGAPPIDSDRYLNIWVVPLSGKFCGYAQMPGGPSATDGIVIGKNFFGNLRADQESPFNEGKTLTHLVGNYLGLYPLWGPGPCQDDLVEDTPIHNASNHGCSTEKHISTCDGYPEEMRMNFMDNSHDACLYMFTAGQKKRMLKMLASGGPRNGLLASLTVCESSERLDEEDLLSLTEQKKLNVFPNPASQELNIDIEGKIKDDLSISVYNYNGQLIYQKDHVIQQEHLQLKLDCQDWLDGIYFVKAVIGGASFSQKLTITNH